MTLGSQTAFQRYYERTVRNIEFVLITLTVKLISHEYQILRVLRYYN